MRKYIVILVLFCFLIPLSACKNSSINEMNDIGVNKNIISQRGFNVSSDSTVLNTSAKGTVFIKELEGKPEEVQIVAFIEIDPNDWGGVSFYITSDWSISNITSSYPENESQMIAMDYIDTWASSAPETEWSQRIEIGRDRNYVQTIGGKGTIVIDLFLDEELESRPEVFNIMVAVGSNEKEGVKIVETDSTRISIPLTDD
jgi:hypothetical protein